MPTSRTYSGSDIDASHYPLVIARIEKDGYQGEGMDGDIQPSRRELLLRCHYRHLNTQSIYYQSRGLY